MANITAAQIISNPYGTQAEEKRLEAAVNQWLHLGGSAALRDQAQAAIESGSPSGNPLLDKIRRAIPESAPLYRGMYLPADDTTYLSLTKGDEFTMLPASFSRSATVATWYTILWHPQDRACILVLTGEWRGFDLAAYMVARDNRRHECQEVITAGRFRVQATEQLSDGKIIYVEQTAVYGIPYGW